MMARFRKHPRQRSKERGAVAVEVAIITPLLVTLLLGVVEFGTVMNRQQSLEAASREGARYATITEDATKADIIVRTTNALEDAANATITVTPNVAMPCQNREGQNVTVTITMPEQIEVLFIGVTDAVLGAKSVFTCTDG